MQSEVPELPNRRRQILDLIESNPGLTIADIQRMTGLARGVVRYHISTLLSANDIEEHQDGRNTRFFWPGLLSSDEKANLSLLRHDRVRQVLLLVAMEPGVSFRALAELLEISLSTLSEMATRLERIGLLSRQRKGRSSSFSVPDTKLLHRLLKIIQPSLVDRLVDHFLDTWSN